MPRAAARPLWTAKRTWRVARISMAVPQVSQSPWAKWASPAENSPPAAYTGMYSRAPSPSCLMSTLPAVSRGPVGGRADGAHERRAGDAQAGQVLGGRPAVGDPPAGDPGVGELVAQEPEAGHLHGVAVAVGLDLEDLDLLARVAADDRGDVGVPAVVAGLRLLGERLGEVDPHLVPCHGHPPASAIRRGDHRRSRPAGKAGSWWRSPGR